MSIVSMLAVQLSTVAVVVAIGATLAWFGLFAYSRISLGNATTKVRRQMLKPVGETVVLGDEELLRSTLTDGIEEMRRAGCKYLAAIATPGHPVAILLADDRTVAEVTEHPWMRSAVIELTSVLMGEQGMLCTSNSPFHADMWDGEFRQTFLGGTPAELLAHHREALGSLAEHGITADAVREPEVLDVRARMLARSNAGAASADRKRIQTELRRMAERRPGPVGRLQDLPDFGGRLDAFWRLMSSTPSQPG